MRQCLNSQIYPEKAITESPIFQVPVNGSVFPRENALAFFKLKENYPKDMYSVSKLFEQYMANEIAKLVQDSRGR